MTRFKPLNRLLGAFTLISSMVLGIVGCGSEPQRFNESYLVFGTLVDVTIQGVDEAKAREALEALREDFNYMHRTWHAWQPGALERVNSLLATTKPFSVAPSVKPLIERGMTLSKKSRGLFNPAMGKLIELWGFHGELPTGPPPSPAEIQRLLDQDPSMDDIELDGLTIRTDNPAVQLDFGAFAKGYGVQKAVSHLRQLGIDNALVNAGGDLQAIGDAGGRAWHIGVRHPRGKGVLASLDLASGECVFTSGDYERVFDHEGQRYHHILDPRTGRPARATRSVTVLHRDPGLADAAATALFVAGPDQWQEIARDMDIRHVMLVDANGLVHMSPSMAERVTFEDTEPDTRISEAL